MRPTPVAIALGAVLTATMLTACEPPEPRSTTGASDPTPTATEDRTPFPAGPPDTPEPTPSPTEAELTAEQEAFLASALEKDLFAGTWDALPYDARIQGCGFFAYDQNRFVEYLVQSMEEPPAPDSIFLVLIDKCAGAPPVAF